MKYIGLADLRRDFRYQDDKGEVARIMQGKRHPGWASGEQPWTGPVHDNQGKHPFALADVLGVVMCRQFIQ